MGLDAQIYVEVDEKPDDETWKELNRFIDLRVGIAAEWDAEVLSYLPKVGEHGPRIILNTLSRYYGPGYERGDWPLLFGAITVMQRVFSSHQVFYGSDSSDAGEACEPEMLVNLWNHFLSADGAKYRER